MEEKKRIKRKIPRALQDALRTVGVFASAVALCTLLRRLAEGDGYVSLVFVLAVAAVLFYRQNAKNFMRMVFLIYSLQKMGVRSACKV